MSTKLFLTNRTQAVRLPKEVAFPDDVTEVEVLRVGDARIVATGNVREFGRVAGLRVEDCTDPTE